MQCDASICACESPIINNLKGVHLLQSYLLNARQDGELLKQAEEEFEQVLKLCEVQTAGKQDVNIGTAMIMGAGAQDAQRRKSNWKVGITAANQVFFEEQQKAWMNLGALFYIQRLWSKSLNQYQKVVFESQGRWPATVLFSVAGK
jgi:hypothetical protein